MTQLMFKIANEPPIDILGVNPALPECVVEIINKALAKNVAERYQSGDEFAQAQLSSIPWPLLSNGCPT